MFADVFEDVYPGSALGGEQPRVGTFGTMIGGFTRSPVHCANDDSCIHRFRRYRDRG